MKPIRASLLAGFVTLLAMNGSLAQGCVDTPSTQKQTDKGAPATTGSDGVAGTGWTGGTGGLMAGVENEKKGQSPDQHNPNVAKGLDPTKGVTGSGESTGPAADRKPKC